MQTRRVAPCAAQFAPKLYPLPVRHASTARQQPKPAAPRTGVFAYNRPPLPLAYFTGNPNYYDALLRANELIREHCGGRVAGDAPADAGRWLPQAAMEQVHGMKLEAEQHRQLVQKLSALQTRLGALDQAGESGAEAAGALRAFLLRFYRPGAASRPAPLPRIQVDPATGRAWARGSRKTARAEAWLVRGNGQIVVNGRHLADAFDGLAERSAVVAPFSATGTVGRYNVWAVVSAGGVPLGQKYAAAAAAATRGRAPEAPSSGALDAATLAAGSSAAGALANAIARALAIHEPQLRPVLSAGGHLAADTRQVERKKPGQPKARKKFTWVKR